MINIIIEKIKYAQKGNLLFEEIYHSEKNELFKNEFLFFIKPEITLPSADIKIKKILEFIITKIEFFNLTIKNITILSSSYLSQYNIIAQHYGVINKVSGNAKKNISEEAKQKFKEIYNLDPEKCNLYGSLEFIKKFKDFNSVSLNNLCQNSKIEKLSGGTYVQNLKINGNDVYIINGFHPQQLSHFTGKGRSILSFTLAGNIKWKAARNDFIGKTNPVEAKKGSIRNELLFRKEEFGMENISSGWNGVHLSAGPVEGLVELIRYNSDYSKNMILTYKNFQFGKLLEQNFNKKQIQTITRNDDVSYNSKKISIFDLTEELESYEVIGILKEIIY